MKLKRLDFHNLYSDCYEINNIKCETKKEYKNLIKKIKNDSKEKNLDKNKIKKKIKEIKFFLEKHYLAKIDLILEKFEVTKTKFENDKILIFQKQIVYNYFNMQRNYFLQKSREKPKCNQSIISYFNICLRILEFATYVNIKKIENVKKICFNKDSISLCFYLHFLKIKDDINSLNKNIIIYGKGINSYLYNNKNILFIDYENNYIPISKPNAEIEDQINDERTFWFQRYFMLKDNKQIKDIFNGIGSIGSFPTKGAKGKRLRKSHDVIDFLDENIYNHNSILENNQELENNLENTQSADTIPSALLLDNKDVIGFNISNKHINSNYKNFLINKKISNNMAKNEMFLYSKAPNINTLKELIMKILEEDAMDTKEGYHRKLILVSLFTGISIDNLIDSFCKKSKSIFFENQNILKIKHQDSIFSENIVLNDEILISLHPQKHSVANLPSLLKDMIYHIKSNINNKINPKTIKEEEYNKIKNIELKQCSKILGYHKKKLSKSISNITVKSIHRLFFHFYHLFNGKTDTGILLLYKISNSNKARVCYVSQPRRLIYYEKWVIKFLRKLSEKNILKFKNEKRNQIMVGSPKVVKVKSFRLFLKNIVKLSPKNKIEKFNLQMIFIRYALSILLATRNFNTSCELLEFSEKFGLLTIHEKAKHVNSSKRLIKVSPMALDYIKLFFELKKEFDYDGYIPILIKEYKNKYYEFVDFNKNELLTFLEKYKNNKKYNQMVDFIKIVELNFGRHVFATESLSRELKKDYENEFMGHYSKGNLGFGIFSNMEVKSYLEITERFMIKIEKKYFCKKINPRNIKCKVKKNLSNI